MSELASKRKRGQLKNKEISSLCSLLCCTCWPVLLHALTVNLNSRSSLLSLGNSKTSNTDQAGQPARCCCRLPRNCKLFSIWSPRQFRSQDASIREKKIEKITASSASPGYRPQTAMALVAWSNTQNQRPASKFQDELEIFGAVR